MVLRKRINWLLGLGMAVAAANTTSAQTPPDDTATPPGFGPTSATVERIMETAVHNIAARYNLNELQRISTNDLMKREVRQFLRDHEAEVWPAIRSMLQTQFGLVKPEDVEEVKRVGAATRPLAKLAKEAIFRANEEWRQILNEEQKKVHDFDMTEMRRTFTEIDTNLASWEEGNPKDNGFFPIPSGQAGPPRPPQPRIPEKPDYRGREIPVGILAIYVEEFIKDYNLNEGQITACRSILVEFQERANTFKNAKKEEFAKVVKGLDDAKRARDTAGIRRATLAHKKALEPFYAIFSEMQERLKGQLTTAQLQKFADRNKPRERDRTTKGRKTAGEKKGQTPKPKVDKPKPVAGDPKAKPAPAPKKD